VLTASVARDLLSLIGNTPIVQITRFDTGPCSLFVKLESQNPGGSIKDRMGRFMIEAAEESGALKPGGTIIEATAGNTGLGLALVCVLKGYKLQLVIPDKMSSEKIAHLRALGAEVILTRSDVGKGHPENYQDLAARIASETGAYFVNQFTNPANPLAHEVTTGPEIWDQMDHDVDAIICGVGSGGTVTGLSRFFEKVRPEVEFVLADPLGSSLTEYIHTGKLGAPGSYAVEGIGSSSIPKVADLSRVTSAYTISDAVSFSTCRELLKREAIFPGSSSGTLVAAALEYCRAQTGPKRVVTFICDSGNKYLSKMYNDYWMIDQGFIQRPTSGDLRDLLTRRYEEGSIITVGPQDTLLTAFQRMRVADVSQVPVMENGHAIGILDESDVLVAVHGDETRFRDPVSTAMTTKLQTIAPTAKVDDVLPILDKGLVALVVEDDRFLGLITRIDLLNHLRRRLK